MTRTAPFLVACVALGSLAVPASRALAQQMMPPPAAPAPALTPLQIDLVIERRHGQRVVGRLPYRIMPAAGETFDAGLPAEVRTGIEVPLGPANGGATRNVGTTINCRARQAGPNLFALSLIVQSSGVYASGGDQETPAAAENRPLLNSLNVNSGALLRDGQTLQIFSSTSPVNGEVTTVDVTLKVLK